MKFGEFKQSLKNGVAPIYVTVGKDAYFKDETLFSLLKFTEYPDFDYVKYDGTAVRSDYVSFLSNLCSYPMMSEKRLVAVDEFYPTQSEFDRYLAEYFKNPQESSVLLVRNADKCDALCREGACVVDFSKPDRATVTDLIKNEIEKKGKKISYAVAEKIAVYSLDNMAKVTSETEKLLDYCHDKEEITQADVDEVVTVDSEFKIYEMTEALGKRNVARALTIIEDLLYKNESPQRLFVSIYNVFRRMFFCAISTDSDAELAKVFGVKEYAIKKTRETARTYKKKELKEIIEKMSENDFKFKSGVAGAYDVFANTVCAVMTKNE